MSRRKTDKTKDPDYDKHLTEQLREPDREGLGYNPEDIVVHVVGKRVEGPDVRIVVPPREEPALQGLTDDPSARVAEGVYAQVFAATWVKRQDLSAERRRTTASVEASLAMNAARGAYAVEVNAKPEEQA